MLPSQLGVSVDQSVGLAVSVSNFGSLASSSFLVEFAEGKHAEDGDQKEDGQSDDADDGSTRSGVCVCFCMVTCWPRSSSVVRELDVHVAYLVNVLFRLN